MTRGPVRYNAARWGGQGGTRRRGKRTQKGEPEAERSKNRRERMGGGGAGMGCFAASSLAFLSAPDAASVRWRNVDSEGAVFLRSSF